MPGISLPRLQQSQTPGATGGPTKSLALPQLERLVIHTCGVRINTKSLVSTYHSSGVKHLPLHFPMIKHLTILTVNFPDWTLQDEYNVTFQSLESLRLGTNAAADEISGPFINSSTVHII